MDDGAQAGCIWMPYNLQYSFGFRHWLNYLQYCWFYTVPSAQILLDWYRGCRVGEASNPGPPGTEFIITGQNVCSTNAFLTDGRLQDFQDDVCAFTETAATTATMDRAAKRMMRQRRHMVATEPSGLRHFSDGRICPTKGTADGVMLSCRHPVRALTAPVSPEATESRRIVDAICYSDTGPIYIGGIYGWHQGHPDALAKTDRLLLELAARASTMKIPAVILGDFNHVAQQLPCWEELESKGWSDAAMVQSSRDGVPPGNTYLECSRLDAIIMNRLATMAFTRFWLSPVPEGDHRRTFASFDWSSIPSGIRTWSQSADLRMSDIPAAALRASTPSVLQLAHVDDLCSTGRVSEAWDNWCQAFHHVADTASYDTNGCPLPRRFRGHGAGKFRTIATRDQLPRFGRHGDRPGNVGFTSMLLRQRLRQRRRLEALQAQYKGRDRLAPGDPQRIRVHEAIGATWSAILRSTGFEGGFPLFCKQQLDFLLPEEPSPQVVTELKNVLAAKEGEWRSQTTKYRRQLDKAFFDADWQAGAPKFFSAIRPPGLPPVDSLDVPVQLSVRRLRSVHKGHAIFMLDDDDLQLVRIGSTWRQGEAIGHVASVAEGRVQVRMTAGSFHTGAITAGWVVTAPQAVNRLAAEYWSGYWNAPEAPGMFGWSAAGPPQPIPTSAGF